MLRLGIFGGTGIIGALLAPLLVVAAAVATGGGIFSAGPLNAITGPEPIGGAWSHSDLACNDCHVPFWSAEHMGDRCLACHTDITEGMARPNTLHANLATPANCRTCHPEHRGADVPLTLFEPDLYPHAEFGFFLISHLAHPDGRAFACQDCHIDPAQPFEIETCSECHLQLDAGWMQIHLVDFGFDCLACHDGIESYGSEFDHRTAPFPLEGAHLDAACSACHAGATTMADLQAAPANCIDCHRDDDTHQGSLGTDCAGCHSPEGWAAVELDHDLTGFPLVGVHLEIACELCHVGGQMSGVPRHCVQCHSDDDAHQGRLGAECEMCHTPADWRTIIGAGFDHSLTRFPLTGAHAGIPTCAGCHAGGRFAGTPMSCVACHRADDAHDGRFGDRCEACHSPSGWRPATFDHGQTGFPLTGSHGGVACERCHAGDRYAGTPSSCAACHLDDDAHDGQFGPDCAACHNTSSWSGATFDHARTSFPLTGRHTSVVCTQCHVNGVYDGTPAACVSCHAADDAHDGQFGTDCAGCHTTGGWAGATFDHARTSFPLTGRHTSAQCTQCHVNGVYDGTPMTCVSCHASDDAHDGQFGTDCAACHTTSGWPGAAFDHSRTAFPLTGRHTSAQCTQCHVNGVYDGTPTTCISCHAADDEHNGSFGTNCGSCHTTSGWGGATFDHSRTSFPLTGRHTTAACTQCHVNGVYDGTPTNCSSCHGAPSSHPSFYGTTCTMCHTSSAWRPVAYNQGHFFPLNHGDSGSRCTTCHTTSFDAYTCYNCHDQDETVRHHAERRITDLTRCADCHPQGRGD